MVLGIDEVGRGCWAGPLVVGACVLPPDYQLDGLTDSKAMTKVRRQKLEPLIRDQAIAYGLGWVKANEIDALGLAQSLKLASQRAIAKIDPTLYDKVIIDGTVDFLNSPRVTIMKQADKLVPSVSAAAVLAKVARDNFMTELGQQVKYQLYGFDQHVGYGTSLHREKLLELGPSDQHRQSFKPVAQAMGNYELPKSKQTGNHGEDLASDWLLAHDFEVLARNWRTRLFEIDIVAKKESTIVLVEVKTRKNRDFGGGLGAITKQKLVKMRRAVDQLLRISSFADYDFRLAALVVTDSQIDGELLFID